MNKVTTAKKAIAHVRSGDTLLIGGFLQGGSPETLLTALLDTDVTDLTIVTNDVGTKDTAHCPLLRAGKVKKIIASFLGLNPEAGEMMIKDPSCVELSPQGTLAERIRAGGAGLGGVLTPVGVGTIIAEGKQVLHLNGRDYLLEMPIHGNVTVMSATTVDKKGNCFLRGTMKNFSQIMAFASDYVIVETDHLVETGELDPELVSVPGVLVDAIVVREGK